MSSNTALDELTNEIDDTFKYNPNFVIIRKLPIVLLILIIALIYLLYLLNNTDYIEYYSYINKFIDLNVYILTAVVFIYLGFTKYEYLQLKSSYREYKDKSDINELLYIVKNLTNQVNTLKNKNNQ